MSEEKKTGSRSPGENAEEGPSRADEFVDKVESSRSGDKAAGAGSSKPPEKRTQETYSGLNELHDALLDDLESSMDQSMRELDAKYEKEFSRLDSESGARAADTVKTGAEDADTMEARLAECRTKVETLKVRLEQSADERYKQCSREVDALRDQLAEAHRTLAGIKEGGQGSVKEGLSGIMAEIIKAVKVLVNRLRAAKETRNNVIGGQGM
jgi:DNA repair exonuclease SbcCD ATPase subunit